MDVQCDEKGLTRKLLLTAHLNVPERRALPGGRVRASVLRSIVEETLQAGQPFTAWWLPDDSFRGCNIQYRGQGQGRLGWDYSGIEGELTGTRDYGSESGVVAAILLEIRQLLGDAIDGMPIDWAS
jgi:hypothetical protein